MNTPKVILASNSPRRQQFFHALGIPFLAESADVDESPAPNESPAQVVERLALAKALTVGSRLASFSDTIDADPPEEVLVIGADTVVAIDGEVLGKPAGAGEAHAMLTRLRARPHQVHTAIAAVLRTEEGLKRTRSLLNTTTVEMRPYSDGEIAAYVATGDPLDKAGAYAVQHQRFHPVESVSGCPAGVMGLPAADLIRLLSEFNVTAARSPLQVCPALTGLQCCQRQAVDSHCHRQGCVC
ncbi:MAG: septum formation protein Maf [Caldilineaceae bacterium SB0661_bin_32]|uniref:dTTP/UTP pyrophosphatase n=1 Tax=Caldilineaceae bacterium SB0661_bin_32 TaxID=2605255 RepID=A0A6B1D3I6_9CHLR|nr:septum formation protein Maf [Caldilineaceae bacterium SB0661_bin_32]